MCQGDNGGGDGGAHVAPHHNGNAVPAHIQIVLFFLNNRGGFFGVKRHDYLFFLHGFFGSRCRSMQTLRFETGMTSSFFFRFFIIISFSFINI